MNWLERYVEGVKSYLPKKNRGDVADEILSGLQDKLEEKESTLGRKLKDEEMRAWVASQQHPMLLAAGFQERRELIAPEVFPFYLQALKIALVIVLVIKVLSAGFYILGTGDFDLSGLFTRFFNGLLESGLLVFGSITLVFHFLGRQILSTEFLKKWKPEDLPKTGKKWETIPIGETIFEIVALVFLFAFMYGLFLGKWDLEGVKIIAFYPGFYNLIPWIMGAIALGILHRIWRLAKPQWTVFKLIGSVAIGVLSLGILIQVIGLDPIVTFDPELVELHPGMGRGEWLNRILLYSLYVVIAVNVYEIGRDIYRISKLNR